MDIIRGAFKARLLSITQAAEDIYMLRGTKDDEGWLV
jgi:hypothetical protein